MKSSPLPADDELDRLVALGITRQQVETGDDRLDCLDPEVLAGYADGGLSQEERAEVEAHLARCRDCRRASALLIESDPLVASASAPAPAGIGGTAADDTRGASGKAAAAAGASWPRIVKSAKVWLPLAATLVVGIGIWFAFEGARRGASPVAPATAQLSARNETDAARQAAKESAPQPARPAAASPAGASPAAAPHAAAPQAVPQTAAPPTAEAPREILGADDAKPADRAAASRDQLRESTAAGSAAAAAPSAGSRDAFRTDAADAAARQTPPSPSTRTPQAQREELAAAARPHTELDKRSRPAAATASAAAPPPPPPLAALADAARGRAGSAPGQESQAKVAGQLATPPATQAAAAAQAAAMPPVAPEAAASTQTANQPNQAAQANQATQNVTQQAYVNQQTGPMSNLNVATSPPAKADERRQAERSKGERAENEKSASGSGGAKSADGASAKPAEEPKTLARAKTASENAAAAADSKSTKGANTPPARPAAGESPTVRAEDAGAAGATGGGVVAGSGSDRNAASRGAVDAAGARASDTDARGIGETVTIVSSAPAAPAGPAPMTVLRSVDGTRWWRIRAPGTIEGSGDRGATWTVEYSEPSARLVRGAAAAKGGCWMIGASGLVMRTRPAGGWERVTQPTTRNLVTVTATDHSIATVTDDQGRTYRTTDGGATWR